MTTSNPTNLTYVEPDGTEHRVTVIHHKRRMHVVDATASTRRPVETLMFPDTMASAWALARDYATQQQAYQVGLREDDPLPGKSEGSDATADAPLPPVEVGGHFTRPVTGNLDCAA
jgi:hypothetical protein